VAATPYNTTLESLDICSNAATHDRRTRSYPSPTPGLRALYRAIGLVRENATSFFMQRILFLQLSHSPWLHSKDLHSNSHCESSGGVFATKGPLTKFLNHSNGLAIPTPS
jgi:hypothetical protein